MDHQSAIELFSEYLDGELPAEQAAELEAHLEKCETCREELETLRKTLRGLAGLPPVPPPDQFARKVQQRIRRRSRGRFFGQESWLTRIPFEWISFVIIILMLLMYFMVIQEQVTRVKPDQGSGTGSGKTVPPQTGPPEGATGPQQGSSKGSGETSKGSE
jgi:anti-sigma factor RsiW